MSLSHHGSSRHNINNNNNNGNVDVRVRTAGVPAGVGAGARAQLGGKGLDHRRRCRCHRHLQGKRTAKASPRRPRRRRRARRRRSRRRRSRRRKMAKRKMATRMVRRIARRTERAGAGVSAKALVNHAESQNQNHGGGAVARGLEIHRRPVALTTVAVALGAGRNLLPRRRRRRSRPSRPSRLRSQHPHLLGRRRRDPQERRRSGRWRHRSSVSRTTSRGVTTTGSSSR